MSDNNSVPEFLGPDKSDSYFVDNSTTINKNYGSTSRSSFHYSGGAAHATFSLFRIFICLLLVASLFGIVFRGNADGWNFQRLLQVLQDAPDISSKLIQRINEGLSNLTWDYSGDIDFIQFLASSWNQTVSVISLIGFFGASAIQIFAFAFYFMKVLFL